MGCLCQRSAAIRVNMKSFKIDIKERAHKIALLMSPEEAAQIFALIGSMGYVDIEENINKSYTKIKYDKLDEDGHLGQDWPYRLYISLKATLGFNIYEEPRELNENIRTKN